jgi:hypothetical protein
MFKKNLSVSCHNKDEERRGKAFKNPEYLILVQILNSEISYVLGRMEYL